MVYFSSHLRFFRIRYQRFIFRKAGDTQVMVSPSCRDIAMNPKPSLWLRIVEVDECGASGEKTKITHQQQKTTTNTLLKDDLRVWIQVMCSSHNQSYRASILARATRGRYEPQPYPAKLDVRQKYSLAAIPNDKHHAQSSHRQ